MIEKDIFEQRYKLAKGVGLAVAEIQGKRTGLIYSRSPLYVTRTSPQIVTLLEKCDGSRSVAEIASAIGRKPATILPALQSLSQKQLVTVDSKGWMVNGEEKTNTIHHSPSTIHLPSVSFLIPVRNRPALLKKCLESVFALDYPGEKIEVIVIDDASEDETAAVAACFPVRLVRNEQQLGTGPSRNKVAPLAKGDLLAFVDSDCEVDPDWLRKLSVYFSDPQQVIVGGLVKSLETNSLFGRYEDVKSSLHKGSQPLEITLNGDLDQLPATNLLIRRTAFEAVGGHDETLDFGEDTDLIWRLLKAGGKVSYRPVSGVKHAYRASLKGFLKTRFGYATGEADVRARHADKPRVLELAPGPTLTGLALAGWLTKPLSRWPLLLAAGGPLLGQTWLKWRELSQYKLPLRFWDVLRAQGRNYGVAGYHLGQHLNRYYSLPLLLAALTRPKRLAWPVALLLLGSAFGDYRKHKPRLSFPAYTALYLLENGAYQLGLVAGCRQARSIRALVPKIVISRKNIKEFL